MRVLRARLYDLEEARRAAELRATRGSMVGTGGSRSEKIPPPTTSRSRG